MLFEKTYFMWLSRLPKIKIRSQKMKGGHAYYPSRHLTHAARMWRKLNKLNTNGTKALRWSRN